MKFDEISENSKVYPGEFLLHAPSNQIVLVGAYNKKENYIRCLVHGTLMVDEIKNFKKINISKREHKQMNRTRCKGCSSE